MTGNPTTSRPRRRPLPDAAGAVPAVDAAPARVPGPPGDHLKVGGR